jgi:aspartyl-tRNA(Asn)/glutamyl-tRNA(Gln) amidotransferase subunit A
MTTLSASFEVDIQHLHDLGVTELAAQLRQRTVSATEVAQHFLARAREHASLGAYVSIDPDITLEGLRLLAGRNAAPTLAKNLREP